MLLQHPTCVCPVGRGVLGRPPGKREVWDQELRTKHLHRSRKNPHPAPQVMEEPGLLGVQILV